jgi:hypothetical protein
MASHAPTRLRPRADPLSAVLATIPSLPRPVLARLTARMIERLDEMDGDADEEPEEDCCEAGDDDVRAGSSPGYAQYDRYTACNALAEDEDDGRSMRLRYILAARERYARPSPASREH